MNDIIQSAEHIVIIQAENPDADSLASSLALEHILGDIDKQVTLYCPVSIPKHLRYLEGWDRVQQELPSQFDCSIIVDTVAMSLLQKVMTPSQQPIISSKPIIIIDHHDIDSDIPYQLTNVSEKDAAATGEVVFHLTQQHQWQRNKAANDMIAVSIMADTLGLTTSSATPETFRVMAQLVEDGVAIHELDEKRREMMKRSADITQYKGRLLQRIEYAVHGALASITIPWEEIEEYSDDYNPSILVMEDMRLTHGVRVVIAYKQYSDGHVTGKIRCNADAPIAAALAQTQGGGGHDYAAGFKVFEANLEEIKASIISNTMRLLKELDA